MDAEITEAGKKRIRELASTSQQMTIRNEQVVGNERWIFYEPLELILAENTEMNWHLHWPLKIHKSHGQLEQSQSDPEANPFNIVNQYKPAEKCPKPMAYQ